MGVQPAADDEIKFARSGCNINMSGGCCDVRGQVAQENRTTSAQADGVVENMTEFADIAGPVVLLEERHRVVRDARDLNPSTASIADELSKQYYLAYPASGKRDGRWHSIRVEIGRRGYRVLTQGEISR